MINYAMGVEKFVNSTFNAVHEKDTSLAGQSSLAGHLKRQLT
jgi:hypothetical protein